MRTFWWPSVTISLGPRWSSWGCSFLSCWRLRRAALLSDGTDFHSLRQASRERAPVAGPCQSPHCQLSHLALLSVGSKWREQRKGTGVRQLGQPAVCLAFHDSPAWTACPESRQSQRGPFLWSAWDWPGSQSEPLPCQGSVSSSGDWGWRQCLAQGCWEGREVRAANVRCQDGPGLMTLSMVVSPWRGHTHLPLFQPL